LQRSLRNTSKRELTSIASGSVLNEMTRIRVRHALLSFVSPEQPELRGIACVLSKTQCLKACPSAIARAAFAR